MVLLRKLTAILTLSLIIVLMGFHPVSASPGYKVRVSFLEFVHEKLTMDDYILQVEFEVPSINHYEFKRTPCSRYASELTPLEFDIDKSWLGLSARLTIMAMWHIDDVLIDINPNRADGRWSPFGKRASALVITYTLGNPPKQISADGNDDGYLTDLRNDAYIKFTIETLIPKGYLQCKAYHNDIDIGSNVIVEVWAPFPEGGGYVLVANQTANAVIELACGTYLVRVIYTSVIEKNVTVAEDVTTYEEFHWFDLIIEPTEGGETLGSPGKYLPGTYVFREGETITIVARPFEGYVFRHWILDGQVITTENPEITIRMNSQHTLKAVFAHQGIQLWIIAVITAALTVGLIAILSLRLRRHRGKVRRDNE